MKSVYIKDFRVGDEFQDFFMLKMSSVKTGANGKDYLDLVLVDSTGEIGAKKWDVSDVEAEALGDAPAGTIIKVRALVNEWNGVKQLKISKIRIASAKDGTEITDFVKASPEKPQDMYDYIWGVASSFNDEDFRKIATAVLERNKEKLMYYPAASKNHHAEMGGLLYHTKRMLMNAQAICSVYTNLNVELVSTGVIIHDIEKINEIESNEVGVSPGYSFEGQLLGHIVMGVRQLEILAEELGLPREKSVMLQHMILSHHYEPEFGSPKKPLFPEAELLHYLDMIDARMYDMEKMLDTVDPGEFTERARTLDNRKLYKKTF